MASNELEALWKQETERQEAISAARDRVVEAALKEHRAFSNWMSSTIIEHPVDHEEAVVEYRAAVRDLAFLTAPALEGSDV